MTTASIILSGGKSSRLGREKYAEVIEEKILIDHVIDRLRSISAEILLVVSQRHSKISTAFPDMKTLVDIYPRKGPLGGIYTGLVYSSCMYNLVVACDMPFLNEELLRYMIEKSNNFDVITPRLGKYIQPLHAVYSKNCIEPIRELLQHNNLKIDSFFNSVKVRYIEEEELNRFDPLHLSFFNINTEADLEKARQIYAETFGKPVNREPAQ